MDTLKPKLEAAISALKPSLTPSGLYGEVLEDVKAKARTSLLSDSEEVVASTAIDLVNAFDQANTNYMITRQPEGAEAERVVHELRAILNAAAKRTILTLEQYES